MSQEYMEICQQLDWFIDERETDLRLMRYTINGDVFQFTVDKTNLLNNIRKYLLNFDTLTYAMSKIDRTAKSIPYTVIDNLLNEAAGVQLALTHLFLQLRGVRQ